ncbi:hypothetical protein [Cellulosilyticum sp. I15G10I2]|uniref:hypothetical protein n=1 Tax=Cellulosilyticum sp. I15G10I2 TaxID=1892843 RepID=UPI00085C9181|nr:hypothetical protein [Cellulosilyticum sp. I15G10I2]
MLWKTMPIWFQELMYNLALLLINLLYVAVALCIIVWLSCLSIKIIKYIIPQYRAKANIIQYLKRTINLYTIVGGICASGINIWFNYPQPVIPQNVKIENMRIQVDANSNNSLLPYDQYEIEINEQEQIDELTELLNQYVCRRSSDYSASIYTHGGVIWIDGVVVDKYGARPLHIHITPGNDLQNSRYESGNTSFMYKIQTSEERSLVQDLINYIDKNIIND